MLIHLLSQSAAELFGYSFRDAHGSNTTRLGAADQSPRRDQSCLRHVLRHLGGFPLKRSTKFKDREFSKNQHPQDNENRRKEEQKFRDWIIDTLKCASQETLLSVARIYKGTRS